MLYVIDPSSLHLFFSSSLQSINVHIDENALHEILNEVDLNKNGQVEIDEFLQVPHTDGGGGGGVIISLS